MDVSARINSDDPAAWNILQFGHRASLRCQAASALPLNEGFQGFTKQRRFLSYASEFLRGAYEIVI
jgi:hypothetical protein